MLRTGRNWHPLARLNVWIFLVVLFTELAFLAFLAMLPNTVNRQTSSALLQIGCGWWFVAFICTAWTVLNAVWLSWVVLRTRTAPGKNLVVGWSTAIVIGLQMLFFGAVVDGVVGARADRDFERSRVDLLIICDRVLAEGRESDSLRDNMELGEYPQVNVFLIDETVYFDIGDNLRSYGYACVAEGETLPRRDEFFEYERKDSRFYAFSEIENLLTPQDETPTPED